MPTRSGLDFHAIHPNWFVCSYCYQAAPLITGITHHNGMITKRVTVRIDDSDDFLPLAETTQIWTEPHCWLCHRRIKGFPIHFSYPERYKYS